MSDTLQTIGNYREINKLSANRNDLKLSEFQNDT